MHTDNPQHVLRQEQFDTLRAIIYAHVGIHFPDARKNVLEQRLARRLTELNLDSFDQYCSYLTFAPQRHEELDEMLSRATVSRTAFMRDAEQVAFLRSTLLPQLIHARRHDRTLRLWSAACSSGQEAYTLAILTLDALGTNAVEWRVEILGTDFSPNALQHAQTARYTDDDLRSVDPETRARHFTHDGPFWQVRSSTASLVAFERHNLKDRLGAKRFGRWDGILCRNALIYFDHAMRARVAGLFAEQLHPDGWLMLGSSESLEGLNAGMVSDTNLNARVYRPSSKPQANPQPATPARLRIA